MLFGILPVCLVQGQGQAEPTAVDKVLYRYAVQQGLSCTSAMRYSIAHHETHTNQQVLGQGFRDHFNPQLERRCLVSMARQVLIKEASVVVPSEGDLQAYFRQHRSEFDRPERFDFEHRYFRSAKPSARQIDALQAGESVIAFPHPLGSQFVQMSLAEIRKRFGVDFAEEIKRSPVGMWGAAVRSPLGWHVIKVKQRLPVAVANFAELRPVLEERWRRQQQERWLQLRLEAMLETY